MTVAASGRGAMALAQAPGRLRLWKRPPRRGGGPAVRQHRQAIAWQGRRCRSAGNSHNTLHLAASILMNVCSCRLLNILTVTARPSKLAYGHQVVLCSTQSGSLQWWSEAASGKWIQTARDLVGYLSNPESLAEMGFSQTALAPGDPDFIVEERMAAGLMSMAVEVLGIQIRDMRYWSTSFPGKFGALVSDDSGDREVALKYCIEAGVCLERLETAARDDDGQPHVGRKMLGAGSLDLGEGKRWGVVADDSQGGVGQSREVHADFAGLRDALQPSEGLREGPEGQQHGGGLADGTVA